MNKYDYYSDWGSYTYPECRETALPEDIRNKYCHISLSSAEKFPSGGIPILVEGSDAYVNDRDENTIIFGETGSKKSRCVVMPLIAATAGAAESAVITDVKGELYANKKLRGYLRERGIRTVCMDFRTFDRDGYNLLEKPYQLYRSGDKDRAYTEITKLFDSFTARYSKDDEPIWREQAKAYLCAVTEIIFKKCIRRGDHDNANMLSLLPYSSIKGLKDLTDELNGDDLYDTLSEANKGGLANVLSSTADKMVSSIFGFVYSTIQPFILEPKLARMLSRSTFDISTVYEKPTFIFLITPDETSAYDEISGMLIDSFYTRLIEVYSEKYLGKAEPACRINYICDEFCNLRINDMKAKISASRSRNMRWFIICQSRDQLNTTYGEHAGTIIGNCRNTLFLQSSDPELINMICDMCGDTTVSSGGGTEKLVQPAMLRELRKERDYREALFIDGNTVFFTELPDIDSYEFLKKYGDDRPPKSGKTGGGRQFVDYRRGIIYDPDRNDFTDEDFDRLLDALKSGSNN